MEPDLVAAAARVVWDETGVRRAEAAARVERETRRRAVVGGLVALAVAGTLARAGHAWLPMLPGLIGSASALVGLFATRPQLDRLRAASARLTERLGTLFAWLFLGPVYLLVVAPFAWARRRRGVDALRLRGRDDHAGWTPHAGEGPTERMF